MRENLLNKIQSSCFYKTLVLIEDHVFFDFSNTQICSAYIQGLLTLLAGTFVLIAGRWAYLAATRETRRHEQQDKSKRQAYRGMMNLVVGELSKRMKERDNRLITAALIPLEINPKYWRDHALLKENEFKDIFSLYSTLDELRLLDAPESALIEASEVTNSLTEICERLTKSLKDPYS